MARKLLRVLIFLLVALGLLGRIAWLLLQPPAPLEPYASHFTLPDVTVINPDLRTVRTALEHDLINTLRRTIHRDS